MPEVRISLSESARHVQSIRPSPPPTLPMPPKAEVGFKAYVGHVYLHLGLTCFSWLP
jgi:hypothetical protein